MFVSHFILDCQLLQSDLDQLSTWSSEWRLLFNELKCSLLSFTSGSSRNTSNLFPYCINNCEVVACSYHNDLGITMSHDLYGSKHITQITCNAYRILGLLRRSFSAINNIITRKLLYISLVRSQLLYGSQIWKPALIKDIKSLEQIQRRATKFVLNDNSLDYKSRLMKLHLLPLIMTLELQDIFFFVRSLKQSRLQCSSFDILQYISFSTNPTRSGSHRKLIQPIVKTTRHKNFYFSRLPLLWTSLPPIDLNSSYDTIKRKTSFGSPLFITSTAKFHVHTISAVHAANVLLFPSRTFKLSNKHVQVLQPPQYNNVTNLNFDCKL